MKIKAEDLNQLMNDIISSIEKEKKEDQLSGYGTWESSTAFQVSMKIIQKQFKKFKEKN